MAVTLNLTLADGNADAEEQQNDVNFSSAGATVRLYASTISTGRYVGGFRFTNVTIPTGATITEALLSVWAFSTTVDDPHLDFYGETGDSPADFSTNADVFNRPLTSASVAWSTTGIGNAGYVAAPDLATIVQEIIDQG
ncbi:MAG: hypothetical protein NUW01_07105, partial [Gemmatimonadaceae bacterium]|nr:hypothetical protein [Gemmatimonadaceae bacterium]